MGGKKSQAFGNLFESVFVTVCHKNGVAVTRVPDGCRQFRKQIIRVKSPWDFVLTYASRSAFIDTKTAQGSTFTYSSIVPHQVRELSRHARCGAISGYLVWTRKNGSVFFIPSSLLASALDGQLTQQRSFDSGSPGVLFLGEANQEITVDLKKLFQYIIRP